MEASSAEQEKDLVETFCDIATSSPEEARFFLESHNWEISAAIQAFFDAGSTLPSADEHPRRLREEEEVGDDGDDKDYIPPQPVLARPVRMSSSRDKKASKPSGSRPGGIRTLADLNRQSDPGSDSDSDEHQEYYAGGEKSGMLVQGPPKGNNDVDTIFDQARQMGAMQGPVENLRPSSSRSFSGAGRLLSGESVPPAPQQPENVIHNIVFWTNGFTVNDGPLRRFDDPDNAPFLESIKKSECPKELEPADKRSAVHVNLTRRDEKCPEQVKSSVPFKGVGRTLGSGSSTDPSEPVITDAIPSSAPPPSVGLSVDDSLPSTSVQLRLADGTRMVARFNYHHTVGDIRAFIDASRPGAARNYQLQTVGFPPKQLADATQTIEQAGLANSVVIQKL